MRLPSPISIAITAAPTCDASDSGSDAVTAHETRSIRHHIRLRTASSPTRRKALLSPPGEVDHTEVTARRRTRTRGSSGSSLLNPATSIAIDQNTVNGNVNGEKSPLNAPSHTQPSVQGPEARKGATGPGPAGSADNPVASPSSGIPHYSVLPVDQSFPQAARPPLPQFHSRQRVPSRHDLLSSASVTDLRNSTLADRHLIDNHKSRSSAMALKFLSGHSTGGSSSSVKHFDVRLDNDYIVFRGSEDEAASAQLAGSVVLCLTEPLNISHVQLTLSGIIHMSWQATSASSMSGRKSAYKEHTFFEKSWPFKVSGKEKSQMLLPDNYEWPFDCILEGGLPESVEGLKDAWIIYRLKAEIGRRRGKDIVVRKPLRIVRTLDPSALELSHAMSVENIWPNKIEYSISTPSKAIIFGSFLRVDFKLIPLLKGLVIGNITTQVREEQEFIVDPSWNVSALSGGQSKHDRVIASDSYTIDAEKDEQIIDEAAEGFQFSRFLELPKSLHQCLQDCNVKGIKVRHKVKFNVQLHNPDGHISELRANLPVAFYISPNLPINEHNNLVDQTPQASRAAVASDLNSAAPPLYGQHTLDKLYSEVDPSGYLTPGIGMSTPGTPYLHSRQPSLENLRSLDAITSSGSGFSTPDGGSVNPAALQHRLQNLNFVGTPPRTDVDPSHSHDASRRSSDPNNQGYFDSQNPAGDNTQNSSGRLSRRESEEDDGFHSGARTPFAQYAHMEDLSRVPSYSTAVKAPAPHGSVAELPTYGAACTIAAPPALPEPPSAHLRDLGMMRSGGSSASMSTGRSPPMNRNLSSLQDGDRRLRLLQMRGR